jgi:hypothetical protein
MLATRAVDFSVVLPVNFDPVKDASSGFPYVGGRLRVNAWPFLARTKLLEDARAAFTTASVARGDIQVTLKQTFAEATATDECVEAILNNNTTDQQIHCHRVVDFDPVNKSTQAARERLAAFREAADRGYLTIEGQLDRGDLNADPMGTRDKLFAVYAALGYRLYATTQGLDVGIRARGGLSYFKDSGSKISSGGGYLAFGLEASAVRDLRRYSIGFGVETTQHFGNDLMNGIESTNIRISFAVPLADGKDISVGIVIPKKDTGGFGDPIIAMSGDWSMLFSSFAK